MVMDLRPDAALAAAAREKFGKIIEQGIGHGEKLAERLQLERPHDALVSTTDFGFHYDDGIKVVYPAPLDAGGEAAPLTRPMHRNAAGQLLGHGGLFGNRNADKMAAKGEWGQRLLVHCLSEITQNSPRERMLVRAAGEQVRAVLSTSYARWDSMKILAMVLESCRRHGVVITKARSDGLRWSVSVVLDHLLEPFENEVLLYGVTVRNSDFGVASFQIETWVERLWCENGCTTKRMMRRNHLGRAIEDETIWSQQTVDLDTRLMLSKVGDVLDNGFDRKTIEVEVNKVAAANLAKIDPDAAIKDLQSGGGLTKDEAKEATKRFASAEIEQLPAGQSAWRLSNVLSAMARDALDHGKKEDLERLAGKAMVPKKAWAPRPIEVAA